MQNQGQKNVRKKGDTRSYSFVLLRSQSEKVRHLRCYVRPQNQFVLFYRCGKLTRNTISIFCTSFSIFSDMLRPAAPLVQHNQHCRQFYRKNITVEELWDISLTGLLLYISSLSFKWILYFMYESFTFWTNVPNEHRICICDVSAYMM